jgi:soluble lytic murein transglycosylase-like protein
MKKFGIIYFLFCLSTIFLIKLGSDEKKGSNKNESFEPKEMLLTSPPCIFMFESIEKYSTKYKIPRYIAYNIAFKETTYLGPFHWKYNPSRESCVGAVGPMQVMPATANFINKFNTSKDNLRSNVSFNVETSMKYLNYLYKRYKKWDIVCGCYNTGRPIINEYARYCSSNVNYKSKWLKLK